AGRRGEQGVALGRAARAVGAAAVLVAAARGMFPVRCRRPAPGGLTIRFRRPRPASRPCRNPRPDCLDFPCPRLLPSPSTTNCPGSSPGPPLDRHRAPPLAPAVHFAQEAWRPLTPPPASPGLWGGGRRVRGRRGGTHEVHARRPRPVRVRVEVRRGVP